VDSGDFWRGERGRGWGWPASPPAAFLPSAFRRNDFCLEAILWEVPGIQGKDEIGIALFGAEAEWIVFGVGRNRSSSLCCPIPKESCGKPPSTRCSRRRLKCCTNHLDALVLFRRRMDSFGRPICRYSRSVNDVVASSHHVDWRKTLGARRQLGKRGRRKWSTTQVSPVLLSPLDHGIE